MLIHCSKFPWARPYYHKVKTSILVYRDVGTYGTQSIAPAKVSQMGMCKQDSERTVASSNNAKTLGASLATLHDHLSFRRSCSPLQILTFLEVFRCQNTFCLPHSFIWTSVHVRCNALWRKWTGQLPLAFLSPVQPADKCRYIIAMPLVEYRSAFIHTSAGSCMGMYANYLPFLFALFSIPGFFSTPKDRTS